MRTTMLCFFRTPQRLTSALSPELYRLPNCGVNTYSTFHICSTASSRHAILFHFALYYTQRCSECTLVVYVFRSGHRWLQLYYCSKTVVTCAILWPRESIPMHTSTMHTTTHHCVLTRNGILVHFIDNTNSFKLYYVVLNEYLHFGLPM